MQNVQQQIEDFHADRQGQVEATALDQEIADSRCLLSSEAVLAHEDRQRGHQAEQGGPEAGE
jgi:hypothetical protein